MSSPSNPPLLPETPLYDSLHTNLPHPIMAFRDFPFPSETLLYPPASSVLEYLQSYAFAHQLHANIRLNTSVTSAIRVKGKWRIILSSQPQPEDFDTLVIANGHYSQPYFPYIRGFEQWKEEGRCSHSMHYRSPSNPYDLSRKTVLVVGGGPSAVDIAPDLLLHAKLVYRSSRSILSPDDNANPRLRAGIARLRSPKEGAVEFIDGSVLQNIDHIIFATGFVNSFPFLSSVLKNGISPSPRSSESRGKLPDELYDSQRHVFPLSRHMIPLIPSLREDELFFIGLPTHVVPFPLARAQASLVVSILTNPSSRFSPFLDRRHEERLILARYKSLVLEIGNESGSIAQEWHKLSGDKQFDYREELLRLTGYFNEEEIEKHVPMWQRAIYKRKANLQVAWKRAVREGRAQTLVKGVESEEAWVALMLRLLDEQDRSETMKIDGVIPKL